MKKHFFILVAMLLCAGRLFAVDLASEFSGANELYAQGKFAVAARSYEAILDSGATSPNLLFNDGNAQFKAGHLGRAIAAFRGAALLSPRDADVRANLEFARNQVRGATLRESRWQTWLGALTLNEWTVLAAITLWLALGLFAAMQIRPALKNPLRGLAKFAAVAAVFFCVCLGTAAAVHFSSRVAVVVASDAVAVSGPFSDAQNVFAVHDGTELSVLDLRHGWVQVSDGSGRSGWITDQQVQVLPAI